MHGNDQFSAHGDLYQIRYLKVVAESHIPSLPARYKNTIKKAIDERLRTNPLVFGKPLRYSLKGHRRLRVGDYRVVYRIQPEEKTVLTVAILHRKKVYKDPL